MLREALPLTPPLPGPDAAGLAVAVIGGKWKPRILTTLGGGTRRFRELERRLPGISRKVLVQQLRELQADGLVARRAFEQVPPRVEYSLSARGLRALPVLEVLEAFGRDLVASREPEPIHAAAPPLQPDCPAPAPLSLVAGIGR